MGSTKTLADLIKQFGGAEFAKEVDDILQEIQRIINYAQTVIREATRRFQESLNIVEKPDLILVLNDVTVLGKWDHVIPRILQDPVKPSATLEELEHGVLLWSVQFAANERFEKPLQYAPKEPRRSAHNSDDWPHAHRVYLHVRLDFNFRGRTFTALDWSPTAFVDIEDSPEVSIVGSTSFYDFETRTLELDVESKLRVREDYQVIVRLRGPEIIDHPAIQTTTTISPQGHLSIGTVQLPFEGTIHVVVKDPKTSKETEGYGWKFFFPQDLSIPKISCRKQENTLHVSWEPLSDATSVRVKIKSTEVAERTQDLSQPDNTLAPFDFQAQQLSPGTIFSISARGVTKYVHGKPANLDFQVPRDQLDVEEVFGNIQKGSGIAISSPLIQKNDSIATIWSILSNSTIAGAIDIGQLKPDGVTVANPKTVDQGSDFAVVTLDNLFEEIYWIAPDGSIQARRRSLNQNSKEGIYEPSPNFRFSNQQGIASGVDGGSIAAVAHTGDTSAPSDTRSIDLWWVDPHGHLLRSICNITIGEDGGSKTSEWSTPSYLVYGQMGPASWFSSQPPHTKEPTKMVNKMATCYSTAFDRTDIVWISSTGRVQGVTCRKQQRHGSLYGIPVDGGTANSTEDTSESVAAQQSTIAIATLDSGDSSNRRNATCVAWVTWNRFVRVAIRDHNDEWYTQQIPALKPAKASVDSEVTLAPLTLEPGSGPNEGKTVLRLDLWWVSKRGGIIKASSTTPVNTAALSLESDPQWKVIKIADEGTVREKGRRSLKAIPLKGGNSVRLAFVNPDNTLCIERKKKQEV